MIPERCTFRLVAGILCLQLWPIRSYGEVTKFPAAERALMEKAEHVERVDKVDKLPRSIFFLCADHAQRLAEPGGPWSPTCIILDKSLPEKRLIWAAVVGDFYVVHYEMGGRGHSYHVLVAQVKEPTTAIPIWRGVGGPMTDYKAFVKALKSGKLDDRLPYAH
jgi:hypothetical protein